jgi:hypothetical protein
LIHQDCCDVASARQRTLRSVVSRHSCVRTRRSCLLHVQQRYCEKLSSCHRRSRSSRSHRA